MYSGLKLIDLLAKKHQQSPLKGLFKHDTFTLEWRAKVGSFPHPDLETLVSAGEPCGAWKPSQGRPEDKRNVEQNWQQLRELPLYGYIPGSSIRGIVRAWAKQQPEFQSEVDRLLGYQKNDIISKGKIEFLDAWPTKPTRLSLDIVNPQESFQVFHTGQSNPLSSYTLGNGGDKDGGDGENIIDVTVAIRGIPNQATPQEVEKVWSWVQQALNLYGVGSRTASGYGSFKPTQGVELKLEPNYEQKQFEFILYTQGCAGPETSKMELRPSHWRGWLRSWMLRFFLGVMTEKDAKTTVNELLGTIEPESYKGCVRLNISRSKRDIWGKYSNNLPKIYTWEGNLEITAPQEILNLIILPVIKFAVSVGGVGRGWRRPLHIFSMNNGRAAARGTHLRVTETVQNKQTNKKQKILYSLNPNQPNAWVKTYEEWKNNVIQLWGNRINLEANINLSAEVFSPHTCAIYIVPNPIDEPLNKNGTWQITKPTDTRGDGMNLIYKDKYKKKEAVGGNAGHGNPNCSWVTIKRVNVPNSQENTDCQEIVCLFMGGKSPNSNHLRADFLKDLAKIQSSIHLFGIKP